MRTRIIIRICSFFIIIILSQCEIEDVSQETQYPVVNSLFCMQDSSRVNLSRIKPTNKYLPNEYINNAHVKLTLPDQTVKEIKHIQPDGMPGKKTEGNYLITPVLPYLPGEYKLHAQFPDGEEIVARTIIPEAVRITEIEHHLDTIEKYVNLHISFNDKKNENNYYALSINEYNYFTDFFSVRENIEVESGSSFVEAEIWGGVSQLVFSDQSFTDSIQDITAKIYFSHLYPEENMDSTVLEAKLMTVSKEYFNYATSFYQQTIAEEDIFAEPVTVYSNITGGYGIFAGYSYHSANIINSKGEIKYRIN